MSTTTPEELVNGISELVSLPEACVRINEMVDDPAYSADDIGKVISSDPALTVRILKIANSPFYGLSTEVDTVSRAITVLGTVQLRDLILASSACKTFDGIPNDLMTMEDFWHHSVFCGITARKLVNSCMLGRGEALFVAGLLHDVGQLILFNKCPIDSKKILLRSKITHSESEQYLIEQQILGFDHTDVGAMLTKQWKLPPCLQECVNFHHTPSKANIFPQEVAVVHIAQAITNYAGKESIEGHDLSEIEEGAWETAGLSEDIVEQIIKVVELEIPEVWAMFSS
ncbi:MAG: phosphohydrolase [Thiotrichales bacterium]|nr:MAG: phosphohydrolase [Thiotrichales bacterium]